MCPRAKSKFKDPSKENFDAACKIIARHPLFAQLWKAVYLVRDARIGVNQCPQQGYAVVRSDGTIFAHPTRRASTEEWCYVLAHCLLHLGFGHVVTKDHPREWNTACCAFVYRFMQDLKLGKAPESMRGLTESPGQDEFAIYERFVKEGIMKGFTGLGTAGPNISDLLFSGSGEARRWGLIGPKWTWQDAFAAGLRAAVVSAVNVAGGLEPHLGAETKLNSPAQQAKSWFISSYPLLGALAAAFRIVEDLQVCQNYQISTAAVDAELKEIYVNPAAKLDEFEMRFVIAHELLHVGLSHESRRHGRDPYLWNVACDYVINGWLIEMNIGELPATGGLYDPDLKGMSADEIYLIIASDLRRYRKLLTLRGQGLGDILQRGRPDWWHHPDGISLDDFYRRCLAEGLRYHRDSGRGFLPAGLVEAIQALSQAPIPWDVELAQWFDNYFAPLEKNRSYARPSRRQSATPDIPRPRYVLSAGALDGRTFAVVLDTSGSMDRNLLAKALGSIASYAISRDVPFVRVVFCDAAPYDEGYMSPESIAERVRVKGRGGTVLQPGIDLVEQAPDFPEKGPILVITDGMCDRLRIARDHAFLIPYGRHLPFMPKGKVFFVR